MFAFKCHHATLLVVLATLLSTTRVEGFSSTTGSVVMRSSSFINIVPNTFGTASFNSRSIATTSTQTWATPPNNNNRDDNILLSNDDQQPEQKSSRRGLLAGSALAIIIAAVALTPASYATDLASISGSASSLASSTNGLMASISETGFYQAFSLVFVSEIGDKTFFMAGLLAVQTSRFISFVGSMAALAVMTIISVAIGQIFHVVPSGFADGLPLDDIAAALAFAFFGYKTLKEALEMEDGAGGVMDEELAEAQEEVEGSNASKQATLIARIVTIFGLVFAAEFGDRSFLSTIALSAAQNPFSVAGGAIAAHAVATGIAVAGGAALSKYLSEKVIGIIGGSLFLVFAATTAFGIF